MAIALFWNFGFLAGILSLIILIFLNGYLTKFVDPERYSQAINSNSFNSENPANSLKWHNLGNSHADKGEYDKAITAYTTAIDLNPEQHISYCNRGNMYEKKGLFDKAIADFAKAIEINPKFTVTYRNRAEAYKNKNFYEQAIADYYRIISIDQEEVYAYFEIAQYLEILGQKTEAIKTYREYLQHASDYDDDVYEAKERLAELGG